MEGKCGLEEVPYKAKGRGSTYRQLCLVTELSPQGVELHSIVSTPSRPWSLQAHGFGGQLGSEMMVAVGQRLAGQVSSSSLTPLSYNPLLGLLSVNNSSQPWLMYAKGLSAQTSGSS